MGAWGHKFNENDEAGDFYDLLIGSKDAAKILEGTLRRGSPHEIRAAARFLVIIRSYVQSARLFDEHLTRAVAALKDILGDKEWIDAWDDPPAAKRELKKELAALNKSVE